MGPLKTTASSVYTNRTTNNRHAVSNFSDSEDEVAAAEPFTALDQARSAALRFPRPGDGRKTKRLSRRVLGLVVFLISWRDLETTQIHFARATSVKVREGLRGLLTGLLMPAAPSARSIYTGKNKKQTEQRPRCGSEGLLNPTPGASSSTGHCDSLMRSVTAGTATYGGTWPKHGKYLCF